jgi:hypothetical protein
MSGRITLRAGLRLLAVALTCFRLQANDFVVATDGTPSGPGTLSSPYDLATALSGQVGQPGDTFWLRGGDYKLGHLDTTIQGAPGQPITFCPVSGENARIDGSLSVFDSIGYVVFRNFELYSSDTNRVSSQIDVGFSPTDISIIPGIACYAPNLSFINLVVHDQTRHAFFIDHAATNVLVYGCILFNNGWVSPDNAEGHGIYAQGSIGTRTISDNFVFNNSGANMHIYENAPDGNLVGVTLDGNVAFNAGAIQNARAYRDWIVGVDAPALYADRIVLTHNMGYRSPDLDGATQPQMNIGRDSTNGSVVLTDNYMPLGLLMNNWSSATVTGNLFAPAAADYVVSLNQTLSSLRADWDNNTYIVEPAGKEVLLDFAPCSFSGWQAATGFDLNSNFVVGILGGTRVFVRPNLWQHGRGNIIVYNWDKLDNVKVDVSSMVHVGSSFEVRNAQDFFAAPVLSGIFDGQPIQLPMTNLTVATPNGPVSPIGPLFTPPPTGPTFDVFVFLTRRKGLQIKQMNDSVQLCWPISSGKNALQWSDAKANPYSWTELTNNPVIVGDQFMITEPLSSGAKFYRLAAGS